MEKMEYNVELVVDLNELKRLTSDVLGNCRVCQGAQEILGAGQPGEWKIKCKDLGTEFEIVEICSATSEDLDNAKYSHDSLDRLYPIMMSGRIPNPIEEQAAWDLCRNLVKYPVQDWSREVLEIIQKYG